MVQGSKGRPARHGALSFGRGGEARMEQLTVEPTGAKDHGPGGGNQSRCVWGFVHGRRAARAAYFVHWTVGRGPDYRANFDLIVGKWGKGATAADRSLVALEYRLLDNGPAFRVIDAEGRPAADSDLVGHVLRRSEVIGQPIAARAFGIVDAVLAQDARVAELLGPYRVVEPGAAPERGGTRASPRSRSPRRRGK
jgi:hypothetical protein